MRAPEWERAGARRKSRRGMRRVVRAALVVRGTCGSRADARNNAAMSSEAGARRAERKPQLMSLCVSQLGYMKDMAS